MVSLRRQGRQNVGGAFLASWRISFLARLSILWIFALLCGVEPATAERLRVGVQKSGTFAWELAVIKARGLAESVGLNLDVVDLANVDAGKIAIAGGSVDLILSDWLWVSRERSLGRGLTFYPYSSAVGAVMARAGGPVASFADLRNKAFGVAGGPLDKSWLLLQAFAKRSGFDIANETHVAYGSPPLLAEKAAQGEFDATLQFWNFCADLEERGFRSVIEIQDVEKSLGAAGPVAMVGYVFDEAYAAKNAATLDKFLSVTRQAKEILAADAEEWPPIMAMIGQKDPGAAALYRKRYSQGVPRRAILDEEADARVLLKTLADVGGEALIGHSSALDPGTYYKPSSGD